MASKQQNRLRDQRKKDGWKVIKIINTSESGLPDLLCLKNGVAQWVEAKEDNDTVKPLQIHKMKQLCRIGFGCFVNETPFLEWLQGQSSE